MELLLDHLGKGLFFMLLISMPIVLVAAGIGLIVGILQAVTQVQEQTIAAAPKILGVFLVIMIGGTLIMRILQDYTKDALSMATEVIPHSRSNNSAPAKEFPDPGRARYEFYNDMKFTRKKEHPKFKDLLNSPMDSPYLKNKTPKPPTTYTPPPALPDANVTEEIQNFKNMSGASKGLRSVPPMQQKAPVIPPFSRGKGNPTISILPTLDEPPAVNPSELKEAEKIASSQSSSQSSITGAAAYLDGSGSHKFDYKVKGSTIIINGGNNNTTASNSGNKNPRKGSIILEAE